MKQFARTTIAAAALVSGLTAATTAQADLFQYTMTSILAGSNLFDGTNLTGSFLYDVNPANGEGTLSDFNFTFTDGNANQFFFVTPSPTTLTFDRNAEWDTTLTNGSDSRLRFNFFNTLANNHAGTTTPFTTTPSFAFEFADLQNNGNFGSNANFAVTAVPEPETYAMFLAGLGLLGFARRNKQA